MSSSFPDPTSHDDCAYKPGNGTHVLYVEANNFYTSSVLESYTPLFALFLGLPRFFVVVLWLVFNGSRRAAILPIP